MSRFVHIIGHVISLASAIVFAPATFAQSSSRPLREAFVVETDGTAEKKLASVAEYAAQDRWDAAVSLLREVSIARPDAVVRVSPSRSLSLPRYCDVILTRLPRAAIDLYRKGADPQAAAWLAEVDATGNERSLRSIVERAFASSSGDEAIHRLAERAWERGDFDLARRYWTLLVPLGEARPGKPVPPVLRYPDTPIDLAEIRGRLVLSSVALGEQSRAEGELDAFRRFHPDAVGHIAGRDGKLADLLAEVSAATRSGSGNGRDGWDVFPITPSTRTFGQTAGRSGFVPFEPPTASPRWRRALPPNPFRSDQGHSALPWFGPLCYYPVIWNDKVFVADAERVFGFELATGRAAWSVSDDDPGVLYPPATDLTLESLAVERPFAANPLGGLPRHTLTVEGNRLYARLGSPITFPAARELRPTNSAIVCLDLSREGLLTWSMTSESLGGGDGQWAFEGPPIAVGDRLYLLASRNRPQAQLNAICLDASTGGVIWNRVVGAPITSPPEGMEVMTHRLVTAAAGRLYVQTNHGAVICLDETDGRPVWIGWYESDPPRSGPLANAPDRNLPAACLFSGGVLVVAPSDSDSILAYDAESGVELWERDVRGGGREFLGARDGVLVVSGERLWGLDLFTGRELWAAGFEDPAGFGAGRGFLGSRFAYWPTREDLFVVEVASGLVERRVPLASVYGMTGGGNLAASPDMLLLAQPDGVVAFGRP